MRTTLDIEPDILAAVKEISAKSKRSAGEVISELARQALAGSAPAAKPKIVNGFEILPRTGKKVTSEFVQNLLRETENP